MKLPFRQGIVKYAVNNDKIPNFLYTDKRENYVSLIATSSKVTITFADNDVDYLFDERETTSYAWGPFDRNVSYWMYWDLDLLTAKRTFGSTLLQPLISEEIPANPQNDQHWFNLSDNYLHTNTGYKKLNKNCMYVWDEQLSHWSHKIRLFAGTYLNSNIVASPLSSQVGVFDNCDAGYILYNDFDSPTKKARNDGTYKFLTSTSHFYDTKSLTTTISLDSIVNYGKASSNIQKYKLVKNDNVDNHISIASHDDLTLATAIGIIDVNLSKDDIGIIITKSYITNNDWNFEESPSSPIYLSVNGAFSTIPPLSGFIQQVGYIVSNNTVYIDTTYQIIYHDVITTTKSMPVTIDINSGKFYTSLTSNDEVDSSIFYNLYGNIYKQPIPNNIWTIAHNSHIQQFLVQVYDSRGFNIVPNNIRKVNDHIFEVEFSKKTQGTALVFLF
jgi:hypothetical protein